MFFFASDLGGLNRRNELEKNSTSKNTVPQSRSTNYIIAMDQCWFEGVYQPEWTFGKLFRTPETNIFWPDFQITSHHFILRFHLYIRTFRIQHTSEEDFSSCQWLYNVDKTHACIPCLSLAHSLLTSAGKQAGTTQSPY